MSTKKSGTNLSRQVANILAMAGYESDGTTEREESYFRWFKLDARRFLVIEDHGTVAVLEVIGSSSDAEKMIEDLRGRL